jgi:N-acetylmuramoyl-L-alanine amidase
LNDALAIDIHLNFLSDTNARGVETFHGTTETSKAIAQAMSDNVSEQLGIPSRGAKSDTASFVGSLGWIRKVSAWSTLVEVCFMSNTEDTKALTAKGGYERAARGIANAVDAIFGEETPVVVSQGKTLADYTLKELLEEVLRRINSFK